MTAVYARILAIDYGQRRIGLAISDPLGHFAVGLPTLERNARTDLWTPLAALRDQYGVSTIVLGLPRNMNGSEGPMAQKVRAFGEALQTHLGCEVVFFDERLTSTLAQQTLRAQGIAPSRQKGLVDQAAAARILQDYLDARARQTSPESPDAVS
ncbi:MAG: Holliday junction resolvase RuvX [Vampirovibrionales bacterium]|nr:Holliday junction resolvase RuvX [Vampirovibrionales bacterium]